MKLYNLTPSASFSEPAATHAESGVAQRRSRMKKRFVATGILLLPLLLPVMANAANKGLYDQMRAISTREFLQTQSGSTAIDTEVQRFVPAVLARAGITITPEDTLRAFNPSETLTACQTTSAFGASFICNGFLQPRIKSLVEREMRVRLLGRDLQILASGYEAPVLGGSTSNFPVQAQAIVRIWRAGTGSIIAASGSSIRAVTLTRADVQTYLQAITQILGPGLRPGDYEAAYTGAVWQYSYGVRFVTGDLRPARWATPFPEASPGSEREQLNKRTPVVEGALLSFWEYVKTKPLTPPLRNGEIVLFTLDKDAKALLPKNLNVWAFREKTKDGQDSGDAGLGFDFATEPVLPSLCKDGVAGCDIGNPAVGNITTLGGAFPPPPLELTATGSGLCGMPYQRAGYLCRAFEAANVTKCNETLRPDSSAVVLGTCTGKTGTRATLAGPDACSDIGWKNGTIPFDPNTQCKVDMSCGNLTFSGMTEPKDANGVIKVTIDETTEGPATYLMIHELVHARQNCTAVPGTFVALNQSITGPNDPMAAMKNDNCCRAEGEAYRAQCQAMSDDGVFGPNGEIVGSTSGLPLNAESCWQILTDYSCRERTFGSCANTFSYTSGNPQEQAANVASAYGGKLKQGLNDIISIATTNKPASIPMTCSATYDKTKPEKSDPRVAAALRELNLLGRKVCDPNRETTYENTIGNNMCALSSCVEQTLEDHRLAPGEAGFTTQDPIALDQACRVRTAAQGLIEFMAQDEPIALPVYRPALMVKQIDTAFCQTNGYPPALLPIACGVSAQNTVGFPSLNLVEQAGKLLNQGESGNERTRKIEELSTALASRIGSELYNSVLQRGVDRLTRVITSASTLLDTFTQVKFSNVECSPKAFESDAQIAAYCRDIAPASSSSSARP